MRPLSDHLHQQDSAWVEKGMGCPTCHGTQIAYVLEDYIVAGKKWGEWEVQKPCPDCSGACNTCWDMGVIRYAVALGDPRFGKLYPCPHCAKGREMATNMHKAELRNAQLPDDYKAFTFSTWDALPAEKRDGKEMARMAAGIFAENGVVTLHEVYDLVNKQYGGDDPGRNSLVFQGDVGMGKTGLAAAIMNYWIAEKPHLPKPLFTRTLDALESVRARINEKDPPSPEDVLDTYKRTRILILDEFNLKQYTPWGLDQIESIVRHRYNNHLPTIFTMNIDQHELTAQWGKQTASAVLGMAHYFELKGEMIRVHSPVNADF